MMFDAPSACHASSSRQHWRTAFGAPQSASGMPSCIALVIAVIFLYPRPAYAYLDPGTGSALIYVISGVVVSA